MCRLTGPEETDEEGRGVLQSVSMSCKDGQYEISSVARCSSLIPSYMYPYIHSRNPGRQYSIHIGEHLAAEPTFERS